MKLHVVMPSGVHRGGAEEALLLLAQARRAAGLELSVTLLEPGDLSGRLAAEGVPVKTVEARRLRNGPALIRTVGRLRAIFRRERPDCVLSWMTKAHLYAGPAARLAGVPALYFQMGLPDGTVVDRLCRVIPAAGALGCSAFVAREQARRVSCPVEAVPLAADFRRFEAAAALEPAELKARLGFDPARPLAGIVGRLQAWKGMHVFAAAVARVLERRPDCQAVIVGGPHHLEPDYPAFLEKTIRRLKLENRVRLAGPQQNVPEWMQAMDVIVHASQREPFGIVVLEAMSLGKPAVAARPGGPEEIIRPGIDGLLTPFGDEAALAGAVLRFLDDPAFAAACGRAARERAAEFTPDRFARNLAAALARLVPKMGDCCGSRSTLASVPPNR